MRIVIDASAKSLGVNRARVLWCSGLSQSVAPLTALDAAIAELERELRAAAAAPSVFEAEFAALFGRMGHPDTTPAGRKLRDRIASHGFKRISPLVDAYNIVAARHAYGIGAHDPGRLSAPLEAVLSVRRAGEGDGITPLGSGKRKRIPVGDLVYVLGDHTVAWLGKRDVDADELKVTEQSASVFFVLLALEGIPDALLDQVQEDLTGLLQLAYPALRTARFAG